MPFLKIAALLQLNLYEQEFENIVRLFKYLLPFFFHLKILFKELI